MRITITLPFLALLLVAAALPFTASAATCNFTRDLEVGVADGEDIRCLQQYLNATGYPVAASGVGSKGSETPQFKEKTKEALKKWQTANKLSATGYFGPLSRAKYKELVSGTTPAVPATPGVTPATPAVPGNETALQARLQALLAQVEKLKAGQGTPTPTVSDKSVKDLMHKAINALEEAEEQIQKADSATVAAAQDSMEDARGDFYTAVEAYLDGNMARAGQYADEAYDNAIDAYEDAGGESQEDEVDELIEKIDDKIDDAEQRIEDADDDGKDVDEAEELLDDAKAKLDEAKTALEDEEYSEAEDLADEAEELVDDAVDAIGNSSKEDKAEDAIDEAKDAIDEAEEAIDDADGDTDDAEDLLEEAKDKLDEAEEAFDDEDFDEAEDLADEAKELAEDAIDEL